MEAVNQTETSEQNVVEAHLEALYGAAQFARDAIRASWEGKELDPATIQALAELCGLHETGPASEDEGGEDLVGSFTPAFASIVESLDEADEAAAA
jgi:hypothetical protein